MIKHLVLVDKLTDSASSHTTFVPVSKFGYTLLERMQETAGMPYHAPTAMFRKRGDWYEPVNPDAKLLCRLAGMATIPQSKLVMIAELRYRVEIVETTNAGMR